MTHIVSSDVHFWEAEKPVALRARLYDFLEYKVHPVVAVDEMAVKRLAILEFDEHRVALRRVEEAEGKLRAVNEAILECRERNANHDVFLFFSALSAHQPGVGIDTPDD